MRICFTEFIHYECKGKTPYCAYSSVFKSLLFSYTKPCKCTKPEMMMFDINTTGGHRSKFQAHEKISVFCKTRQSGLEVSPAQADHCQSLKFLITLSVPLTGHIWAFDLSRWHKTRLKQHMTKQLGCKQERNRWQKHYTLCHWLSWPNCPREERVPFFQIKTNGWSQQKWNFHFPNICPSSQTISKCISPDQKRQRQHVGITAAAENHHRWIVSSIYTNGNQHSHSWHTPITESCNRNSAMSLSKGLISKLICSLKPVVALTWLQHEAE